MSSPLIADGFWSIRSVNDLIGFLGFVLTVGSIWYAWYLAKRQLRADFRKAAAEAVERVGKLLLGNELAEAIAFLREAEAALTRREWTPALLRLQDAVSWLARLSESQGVGEAERRNLTRTLVTFRDLIQATKRHALSPRRKAHLDLDTVAVVTAQVAELERMRGRLVAVTLSPPLSEHTHE